jgi:hypothetical protein
VAPTPSGQKPFGVTACITGALWPTGLLNRAQNIVGARLPAIAVGQSTTM